MESMNWSDLDTIAKMREWIDSSPDSDEAFEKLFNAHTNEEKGLNRWIAAAIIGDFSGFGFPDEFLATRWDSELMTEDSEYFGKIQETVLNQIREIFKEFTGLEVIKDDRRAAGSEDVDIDINEEGVIESISEYWLMASNETFWNVSFEFYDDGPTAVFEYVEGSYEELHS